MNVKLITGAVANGMVRIDVVLYIGEMRARYGSIHHRVYGSIIYILECG